VYGATEFWNVDWYVGHMPEYLCEEQDRVVGVRSFFISKNKLRRC